MTIYGLSEELVSRCVECDLAEPESLASLGGSAPGVVDRILSLGDFLQLAVHPNTESMKQAAGAGDDWLAFEVINHLTQFEFVGFQGEIEPCKW